MNDEVTVRAAIVWILLAAAPDVAGQGREGSGTAGPVVSSGSVRRLHVSSLYVDARTIDVWLPDGYDGAKRYAVLYMNDGQNLFDSALASSRLEWMVDETASTLMREGKIRDAIVVGIPNAGAKRRAEYFPQKIVGEVPEPQRGELLAFIGAVPRSDDYLRFLVTELKPVIDSAFSTLIRPEHTFICGSSTGALGALYALCEYPQVFGGAACLSTHWTGTQRQNTAVPSAIAAYLASHLPSSADHRVYFDHGTETLDTLYAQHQARVDSVMREAGYSADRWMTMVFRGAEHSERSWAGRLRFPLEFLLRPQAPQEGE